MKIEWNRKYTTIAVYVCLVIVFAVAAVMIGVHFDTVLGWIRTVFSVLSPLIYGFCIAYVLNPLLKLCETKWLAFIGRPRSEKAGAKKKKLRLRRRRTAPERTRRILGVIITYLIFLIIVTLIIWSFAPQLASSYADLNEKLDGYVDSASHWVDEASQKRGLFGTLFSFIDVQRLVESLQELISDSYSLFKSVSPYVTAVVRGLVDGVKDFLLGMIISIYFLLAKERLIAQLKKGLNAVFARDRVERLVRLARYTDKTFGGFIIGKLIDSLIIGVLTFIVLAIFRIPYYQLIAVIVGVTNVIPFFGPIIGAIPSAFIVFIAEPKKALWFILIILVIQQLDGNVIGPKIIGDSIGLDSIWILIAIIVMGGLFGVPGMFFGVPVFALLYNGIKQLIEQKLKKKNLPPETAAYLGTGLPEETNKTDE